MDRAVQEAPRMLLTGDGASGRLSRRDHRGRRRGQRGPEQRDLLPHLMARSEVTLLGRIRLPGLDPQRRYRVTPVMLDFPPSGLVPPLWWGVTQAGRDPYEQRALARPVAFRGTWNPRRRAVGRGSCRRRTGGAARRPRAHDPLPGRSDRLSGRPAGSGQDDPGTTGGWHRWTMSHDQPQMLSDAIDLAVSTGSLHDVSSNGRLGYREVEVDAPVGNDGHGYLARPAGRCRRVLDQSSRRRQVAAHRLVWPDHRQPDCRSAGRVAVRRPKPVHARVRRIGDGDGGCLPARRERGEQADQCGRHVDGRGPAVPAPAVSARIPLRGRASGHRRLVVRDAIHWMGRAPSPASSRLPLPNRCTPPGTTCTSS